MYVSIYLSIYLSLSLSIYIYIYIYIYIEVRTGTYRQLFHPEQLISGKEDAATSFIVIILIHLLLYVLLHNYITLFMFITLFHLCLFPCCFVHY